MTATWLGLERERLGSCVSTNDIAMAAGRNGAAHGWVAIADAQTGGRGRLGRTWHSPPRRNLYLSCLLRPSVPPTALPPLGLVVAVAAAQAVEAHGIAVDLKWPNDLLVEGKKVGGILVESVVAGDRTSFVVVGLGLNVNGTASELPLEIAETATTLEAACGHEIDREALLGQLLSEIEHGYDRFVREGPAVALAGFAARSSMIGRTITVHRGDAPAWFGRAEGIDPAGQLLVRDEGGTLRVLSSGEVTVRPSV